MIAMQYNFTLPSDYDMDIIEQRINEKGHMIDGFPGLLFKAYLWTRSDEELSRPENFYAPFYVWEDSKSMSDFISSAGFKGLVQSFGWPVVRNWIVWEKLLGSEAKNAKSATREIVSISPFTDIEALRDTEVNALREAIKSGDIVGGAVAFQPGDWTLVRFRMFMEPNVKPATSTELGCDIGYMSISPAMDVTDKIGGK